MVRAPGEEIATEREIKRFSQNPLNLTAPLADTSGG
jgi:hypothetical protein